MDTWDTDDGKTLETADRDVLKVGYPIDQNRTSAEPDIGVEVVPS